MMHYRKRSLLCAAASFALLQGCASETALRGEKLGVVGGKHVAPTGIPYTLTRPFFTVTPVPAAAGSLEPTYTLSVEYRPDTSQTYTIMMDPAVFANPDFSLTLVGGTLTGTKASATSQVVPFITTLGSVAANIAAAAAVLDKAEAKGAIAASFKANKETACTDPSDVPAIEWTSDVPNRTVGKIIAERIERYKDDDAFEAGFHYVTEKERACISAVATAALKDATDEWNVTLQASPIKASTEAQAVAGWVTKGDVDSLEQRQKEEAAKNPKSDISNLLSSAIGSAIVIASTKDVLETAAKMAVKPWRARQLVYLESMSNIVQRRLALADQKDPLKAALKDLEARIAQTIDTVTLNARKEALEAFLAEIQQRDVQGGKAPAASEYATYRAELDEVLKRISDRRTQVASDAQPPAKTARKATKNVATGVEVVSSVPTTITKDSKPYLVILKERD